MSELQITLQILGVIALVLFIVILVYAVIMLKKISQRLDSILEIVDYYNKAKLVVSDFMAGPGRAYITTIQAVLSFIVPLLTNRRKSK